MAKGKAIRSSGLPKKHCKRKHNGCQIPPVESIEKDADKSKNLYASPPEEDDVALESSVKCNRSEQQKQDSDNSWMGISKFFASAKKNESTPSGKSAKNPPKISRPLLASAITPSENLPEHDRLSLENDQSNQFTSDIAQLLGELCSMKTPSKMEYKFCESCSRDIQTNGNKSWTFHIKSHCGADNELNQHCPTCFQIFHSPCELSRHEKKEHPGERTKERVKLGAANNPMFFTNLAVAAEGLQLRKRCTDEMQVTVIKPTKVGKQPYAYWRCRICNKRKGCTNGSCQSPFWLSARLHAVYHFLIEHEEKYLHEIANVERKLLEGDLKMKLEFRQHHQYELCNINTVAQQLSAIRIRDPSLLTKIRGTQITEDKEEGAFTTCFCYRTFPKGKQAWFCNHLQTCHGITIANHKKVSGTLKDIKDNDINLRKTKVEKDMDYSDNEKDETIVTTDEYNMNDVENKDSIDVIKSSPPKMVFERRSGLSNAISATDSKIKGYITRTKSRTEETISKQDSYMNEMKKPMVDTKKGISPNFTKCFKCKIQLPVYLAKELSICAHILLTHAANPTDDVLEYLDEYRFHMESFFPYLSLSKQDYFLNSGSSPGLFCALCSAKCGSIEVFIDHSERHINLYLSQFPNLFANLDSVRRRTKMDTSMPKCSRILLNKATLIRNLRNENGQLMFLDPANEERDDQKPGPSGIGQGSAESRKPIAKSKHVTKSSKCHL